MTTLITGGCGLVGLHVAKALLARGTHVVCLDLNDPSPVAHVILGERLPVFARGDSANLQGLLEICKAHAVDTIIHAAALVNETAMRADPWKGVNANVLGTAAALEAARRLEIRRMVYTSSGTIYGRRTDNAPIRENEVNPEHLYAETKYVSERLIGKYRAIYGTDVVIVRISSAYGPGKPWKPDRYPLQQLCSAALYGVACTLEQGSNYTRDYSYVADVADGVVLAADSAVKGEPIYNIAGGRTYTLVDVADALTQLVPGARLAVGNGTFENDLALRASMRGPLAIERAQCVLGYTPRYSLKQGLADYLAFLRAHPEVMRDY